MPTTTKMGIVYPSSTDLVKDGATAMGTISTTVDNKTGLVLINSTSFSAVSSQSVNDVFSANYDRYKIVVNQTGTLAGQLRFRVRVSGSDNSATNYRQQGLFADDATVAAGRNTGLTFWTIGRTINGHRPWVDFDIINIFDSTLRPTFWNFANDVITGNLSMSNLTGALDVTTSYTGFTLLAENGSITGNAMVYGYNK